MDPNRRICYCYNVTFRKLHHFAKRTRPQRASQLSECLGAGTGCGWCIPFLKNIHAAALEDRELTLELSGEEYEARRADYIKMKKPRNRF